MHRLGRQLAGQALTRGAQGGEEYLNTYFMAYGCCMSLCSAVGAEICVRDGIGWFVVLGLTVGGLTHGAKLGAARSPSRL